MPKARPSLTLVEMEAKLGYRVDSLNYPHEHSKRFYSNLRPVPDSIYQRTREEFEEFENRRYSKDYATIPEQFLQTLGKIKVNWHPLKIREVDMVTDYYKW